MADTVIRIEGGEELQKKLEELSRAVGVKVMEEALTAGAEVIRAEAERKAPRRTGKLASNIIVDTDKKSKAKLEVTVDVGPSEEAFYGRFVELGTSKMSAKPFLRPAFDSKVEEATEITKQVLAEAIEDAAKK